MSAPAQRLLCVADVHAWNHRVYGGPVEAGLNTRCRNILQAFQGAVNLASEKRCSYFASLGDLTDGVRPEPQILAALQAICARDDLEFIFELGNHEMVSTAEGDHALGPLAALLNATVVAEAPYSVGKAGVIDFAFIPFHPGPAKDWLPKEIERVFKGEGASPAARVLGIHLGIADKDTPDFIQDAHDSIRVEQLVELCAQYGVGVVVSGNWHRRGIWRGTRFQGVGAPGSRSTWGRGEPPLICQVGTLCPTGWDNPGLDGYGSAIEVGLGKKESDGALYLAVHEIPGPRFVVMKDADGEDAYANAVGVVGKALRSGCQVYVNRRAAAGDVAQLRAEPPPFATPEGTQLASYDVVSDGVDEKSAMQSAAIAARSGGTIDDAVRGYVDAMPLPEDVAREAVKAEALRYLGRGS